MDKSHGDRAAVYGSKFQAQDRFWSCLCQVGHAMSPKWSPKSSIHPSGFFVRSIENCFWISKFSGAPASLKEFLTIAKQPQVDFSVREAALAVGMSPARHMVEADLTWFEGMGNRVTNVLSTFHVNCTSGQICLVLVGLRDLQ